MPTRATPPKRYSRSYGTLVDDFDDTGWSLGTDNALGTMVEQDTDHVLASTSSLKAVKPAGETKTLVDKTGLSLDLSDAKTLTLWLYLESDTDSNGEITIILKEGANSRQRQLNFGGSDGAWPSGWFAWHTATSDFTGTADWSAIDTISLRCKDTNSGAAAYTVWFDSLYKNVRTRPKLMIVFDDSNDNHYDIGFTYMNPRGVIGNSAIKTDKVRDSVAGQYTIAQAQEMYDAGWQICNHSTDGDTFTPVGPHTQAEYMDNLDAASTWIAAQGWGDGGRDVSLPGCQISDNVINELESRGYRSARRCTWEENDLIPTAGHPNNTSLIPVNRFAFAGKMNSITLGDTSVELIAFVDKLISTGSSGMLIFHGIVASGATALEVNEADFNATIDAVANRQNNGLIDVITFKEFWEGV